jgi:ABC-2 type transport system ATP-binding protein
LADDRVDVTMAARQRRGMSTTTLSDTSREGAADSPWAVETHGLIKRFGATTAVNGVELQVPRGCAFGYLGPNGAGKTTLIRVLLGLTHADAGEMSLLGYRVPKDRDRALARVGAIVDEPRFHGHLSGRDNLAMLASSRERAARDRIDPALHRVGLAHRADDRVAKYSMGMRQRLGVAACLLGDPQLLILDEPMNGLDPAGMSEMRDMILSFVDEGRTVVLSSHLLDEVQRTCDSVAIVDRGTVIRQGPIAELLAGSSVVLDVECSEPDRACALVEASGVEGTVDLAPLGLRITLPAGAGRDVIAEVSRVIVEHGLDLYRLEPVQASLESWFLEVTSRLGAPE